MADGNGSALVERVNIGLELGGGVALIGAFQTDKGLEGLDRGRGNGVSLAVPTPAVDASIGEAFGAGGSGGVAFGMAADRFIGQFGKFDSAHLRWGAGEVSLNQIRPDPDGFKKLAAVVAAEHADAHFRHDFEEAFVDRLAVSGDDFGGVEVGKSAFRLPASGQLPHEVGRNGRSAKANQTGKVVNVAAVGRVGNERGAHAQASTDQAVMHGGDRQKHG